jgi:hypothetical protein
MQFLFMDRVSINYQNLNKTVRSVFEESAVLYFKAHLEGPYFWRWNDQIH